MVNSFYHYYLFIYLILINNDKGRCSSLDLKRDNTSLQPVCLGSTVTLGM